MGTGRVRHVTQGRTIVSTFDDLDMTHYRQQVFIIVNVRTGQKVGQAVKWLSRVKIIIHHFFQSFWTTSIEYIDALEAIQPTKVISFGKARLHLPVTAQSPSLVYSGRPNNLNEDDAFLCYNPSLGDIVAAKRIPVGAPSTWPWWFFECKTSVSLISNNRTNNSKLQRYSHSERTSLLHRCVMFKTLFH